MTRVLAALLALQAPEALAAQHRTAQTPAAVCGPAGAFLAGLLARYHEAPIWTGLSRDSGTILTQTADGNTWTLLRITQHGDQPQACMVGSGGGGHVVDQGAPT